MTKWIAFLGLTAVTGSPLLSLGLLVVAWWTLDRFTLGILPDPIRALLRWRRQGQLRRTLVHNPHDRAARFELADLLVAQKRFDAALTVLQPYVEAGDDDPATLLLMGQACHGSGRHAQGVLFLESALEANPGFRQGALLLERGRGLAQLRDFAGAKEALTRFVQERRSTVEGRVLLSRAHEALGEKGEAARLRDEAWKEFAAAPGFQRRRERFWAWRAKPSRPLAYVAVAATCGLLFANFVLPSLQAGLAEAAAAEDEELPYEE